MQIVRTFRTLLRKAIVFCLIAFCTGSTFILQQQYAAYADGVPAEAKKGVVRIFYADNINNPGSFWTGSGFGVGEAGKETDIFVTNRHVVCDDATGKIVDHVYILLDDDAVRQVYGSGSFYDLVLDPDAETRGYGLPEYSFHLQCQSSHMVRCKVLFPGNSDPVFPDYAIIQAEKRIPGRVALPLQSAETVPDGTAVWTVGYPGSADYIYNSDESQGIMKYEADTDGSQLFSGTISTKGTIKDLGETLAITHSAQIDGGNSGGPLVTDDGVVIGINTYSFNTSKSSSVGYYSSVYVDYAMERLNKLGIAYDKGKAASEGAAASSSTAAESNTMVYAGIAAAAVAGCIVAAIMIRKQKQAIQHKLEEEQKRREEELRRLKEEQKRQEELRRLEKEKQKFCLYGSGGGYFDGKTIPVGDKLTIGRDPSSGVCYPDAYPGVSRNHAVLKAEAGKLTLQDLSSEGVATFVKRDGKAVPLAKREKVTLNVGDVFYIGAHKDRFEVVSDKNSGITPSDGAKYNDSVLPQENKRKPKKLYLSCRGGYQDGREFEIGQELWIGRDSSCMVHYPDDGSCATIGRKHAVLKRESGNLYLYGMSQNGTKLKRTGEILRDGGRAGVAPGDVFYVADQGNRFEIVAR